MPERLSSRPTQQRFAPFDVPSLKNPNFPEDCTTSLTRQEDSKSSSASKEQEEMERLTKRVGDFMRHVSGLEGE